MPDGSRYFDTWWNRDFFTMSLRSTELVKTTRPRASELTRRP